MGDFLLGETYIVLKGHSGYVKKTLKGCGRGRRAGGSDLGCSREDGGGDRVSRTG